MCLAIYFHSFNIITSFFSFLLLAVAAKFEIIFTCLRANERVRKSVWITDDFFVSTDHQSINTNGCSFGSVSFLRFHSIWHIMPLPSISLCIKQKKNKTKYDLDDQSTNFNVILKHPHPHTDSISQNRRQNRIHVLHQEPFCHSSFNANLYLFVCRCSSSTLSVDFVSAIFYTVFCLFSNFSIAQGNYNGKYLNMKITIIVGLRVGEWNEICASMLVCLMCLDTSSFCERFFFTVAHSLRSSLSVWNGKEGRERIFIRKSTGKFIWNKFN